VNTECVYGHGMPNKYKNVWSYSYKRNCPQHTENEQLSNGTMAQKKESRLNWTSVKQMSQQW